MARLQPIAKDQLTPGMAELIERVKFDPGYYSGLSVFAHSQEFVEPMWNAYVDMFEGGLVDSRLKEMMRIKIAYNNDCFT
ncbi:MAG: hypothetical protein AAF384_09350 [Pseudomonadota bacterium]